MNGYAWLCTNTNEMQISLAHKLNSCKTGFLFGTCQLFDMLLTGIVLIEPTEKSIWAQTPERIGIRIVMTIDKSMKVVTRLTIEVISEAGIPKIRKKHKN